MLPESFDGSVLPGYARNLHRHVQVCPGCRYRWERARQAYVARRSHQDEGDSAAPGEIFDEQPHNAVLYTDLASPIGVLWIASGPHGLVRVESNGDEALFCHAIERTGKQAVYAPAALESVTRQFVEYFAAQRTVFDLSVDLSGLTPFCREVLRGVQAVPHGEVRSYGEIAHRVGKPRAARAVGTVVATNPLSIVIPCHRIVKSDGTPGEYALRDLGACGAHIKLMLLALEGRDYA